jgi:cytochrome c peroxidase
LGQATTADLTLRWPDGSRQTFTGVAANQRYRLEYGQSQLQILPTASPARVVPTPNALIDWPMLLGLVSALGAGFGLVLMFGSAKRLGAGLLLLGALGLGGAAWLTQNVDMRLQALLAQAEVRPPTHPPAPSAELVKLGEALFWDPELSGNRDITCATCHHPNKATGDNLSLSIGTGGEGLGETRVRFELERELIPRNAQPLFNLGYAEWQVLFWDGRVNGTHATGFNTPASDRLPAGLDNLLAAQAMFPVTSRDEMRGLRGDVDIFGQTNELANLVDYAARPIWKALMKRLLAISGYVELFNAAYPSIPTEQLGFQHAANALAAYEIAVFTFEDSPFDRYLHGDLAALSPEAKHGALLFYGEAGCAQCHSTGLLTDQQFHNLAVPQIGDGKGREQPFDLGRARETGNACDRYAFRTPPLRNVALTGPWMHDGAFTTLEATIRHHLNPVDGLLNYDPAQLTVLIQDKCQNQPETLAAILASLSPNASAQATLSDAALSDLLAFMDALTAPSALNMEDTIPDSVPSGLPVGGNITNPAVMAQP